MEYAVGCRMVHKDLIYEILSVVEEIPEGCVATYGQIARLIGRDKNSRLVGKVLSMAEYYGDYPCHRVVNHAGRLVPGWLEQRLLLEAEQVVMKDDRHVDLKKCRWARRDGGRERRARNGRSNRLRSGTRRLPP